MNTRIIKLKFNRELIVYHISLTAFISSLFYMVILYNSNKKRVTKIMQNENVIGLI